MKKKNKKKEQDEITRYPLPSFFILNRVSINHMIDRMPFLYNSSLLELVNSFSISLILLIVIFILSKLNCLEFLGRCKYKIWKLVIDDLLARLLSSIPSMELCGVECGMFIYCEKYCLSLFHSCLVFKQVWNKWSEVSSSSLQYEQRGESTFLNLKNILFRYRTLFNNLYWNILRFVSNVTRLGNK